MVEAPAHRSQTTNILSLELLLKFLGSLERGDFFEEWEEMLFFFSIARVAFRRSKYKLNRRERHSYSLLSLEVSGSLILLCVCAAVQPEEHRFPLCQPENKVV